MKKVEITAYGAPEAVAHCIEAPDVGEPGAGEIVFDVLAFPINPADLSMIRGNYRLHPPLPATPGAECVGRVAAVGAGVALRAGDWVIQNVANSAVGRHLIVLARARGIRTVNVVRRDDVAVELRALGADAVLTDGPDLAERARAAAGDAPIRLGIDAVSGGATKRIADCVAEGGVVVSYGSMSGEDPVMSRAAMSFRAVSLTSFNLGRGLAKRTPEEVRRLYAELAAKLRDGVLKAPIDARYPIEEIKAALVRAQQ